MLFNSKDDLNQDPMEGVIAAGEDPDAVHRSVLRGQRLAAYHATAGVKADGGGDVGAFGLHMKARRRYNCVTTTFIPTVRRRSRSRFPPILVDGIRRPRIRFDEAQDERSTCVSGTRNTVRYS